MKKSLLIATPYLNNIGGTEIEAVTTAVYLYDSNHYKNIVIFTPKQLNSKLFKSIIKNRNIEFIKYPKFFSSKIAKLINRFFFKIGFSNLILEYIFWKYKSIYFQHFFILTYPKSVYFFSILEVIRKQKRVIAKITLSQFDALPKEHLKYYKKIDKIIVFNEVQKDFWINKNQLNTIESLDILIPNEQKLLAVKPLTFSEEKCLNLGYLGRISKEKNLEDMIRLLDFFVNKEKKMCKLIIQGSGDIDYVNSLKQLAETLNVWKHIDFRDVFIDPMQSHLFFNEIDIFLVTSIKEGGPITALEAAASGRMLLSYNVGAMDDRFSQHTYVINNTFEDLCRSLLQFMKLIAIKKIELTVSIKQNYELNLSNHIKGKQLQNIILNE